MSGSIAQKVRGPEFRQCRSTSQMRSPVQQINCGSRNSFSHSFPPLFSLPPPPTSPRSLPPTFLNFPCPNGFKASVYLGYVPSLVTLCHCAILGIEQRV